MATLKNVFETCRRMARTGEIELLHRASLRHTSRRIASLPVYMGEELDRREATFDVLRWVAGRKDPAVIERRYRAWIGASDSVGGGKVSKKLTKALIAAEQLQYGRKGLAWNDEPGTFEPLKRRSA